MFVADFHHDANVDGIRYFCGEVLPLVARERPDVRLRIVGASPPGEVQALAGPNVEVLGFVQDLDAIYRSSDVSIAPMRFGGGLKGKIAEAMAFGVPVATNSISLTGFEARPGVDVMVGDDPQAYAQAVLALLRDDALYDSVRRNAWHFVHANYSREAVGRMLDDIMARIPSLPVKQLPLAKRAAHVAQSALERHVTWRFR
jgi:glycosyltransferase involved in cell wall biosynthesis